jgi:hypothetical protein
MTTPYDEQPTEASLSAAEAAHLAARDTVALDLTRPAGSDRRSARPDEPAFGETELANLPTVRIAPQRRPVRRKRAPLMVAALVNTSWATLVGLVPLLLIVALAPVSAGDGIGPGLIAGLAGWLLAHGVPLGTPIGPVAMAPLAVTLLVLWRLARAGVHTTRGYGVRDTGDLRHALTVAGSVAAVYSALGATAAALVDAQGIHVTVWRAAVHFAVLGLLAAFVGSIRSTGALRAIARGTPLVIRDGIRTGAVAAMVLLGAGAGVTGLAIALGGGEAADFFGIYQTGIAGQAGLTLVCLAYAPNLATWTAAYLVGPGFAVGADTVVRASQVAVGKLPAVPVLAGLPLGPLHGGGWLLLVLPLIAGGLSSVLLVRRRVRPRRSRSGDIIVRLPHWRRLSGAVLIAGPVAGLLVAAAAYASGGSLGAGRLARMGPVPWQAGAATALVMMLGGLIGLVGVWAFRQRSGSSRQISGVSVE